MRFFFFSFFAYLFGLYNLQAKTLTLQEYGLMLQTIEVIAKESMQKKDYSVLVAQLQELPEKITINYTIENKNIEKNIHLSWLRNYLKQYISETETAEGNKVIEILENAQENEEDAKTKIIPIAEKVHTLMTTLQNMREELLLMGYKSENEENIKNKLNKFNKFEKEEKTDTKENWLNKQLKKIQHWLNKNFSGIQKVWNWFLVIVLIGILVLLGIQAKKYIKRSEKFIEETTHNGLLQADDPRSSKELVFKAKEYEKKGNLRMAVRYYYVAFIIALEEEEILPYQPHFTNWEYYKKLLSMGYEQEEIYSLTSFFDKVWYGMYVVENTEYQEYTLNYEKAKNILATAKA